MSETTLENLEAIYLIHPNFGLKTSLLFYRTSLFMRNYKIKCKSWLSKLYASLSEGEHDYIQNTIPMDIKLWDEKVKEEKGIEEEKEPEYKVSKPKIIKKEVVSSQDEKYRDFDWDTA